MFNKKKRKNELTKALKIVKALKINIMESRDGLRHLIQAKSCNTGLVPLAPDSNAPSHSSTLNNSGNWSTKKGYTIQIKCQKGQNSLCPVLCIHSSFDTLSYILFYLNPLKCTLSYGPCSENVTLPNLAGPLSQFLIWAFLHVKYLDYVTALLFQRQALRPLFY